MLQRHQHRHQDSLTNEETTGIHAFSCFSQFSYRICVYLCVCRWQTSWKWKVHGKYIHDDEGCSLLTVYLNRSLIYAWIVYSCRIIIVSSNSTRFTQPYHKPQLKKVAFHVIAPLIRYVWNTLLICVHFLCGPTFSKAYVKEWSEEFRQTMRKWCVIKEVLFWFVLIASLSA